MQIWKKNRKKTELVSFQMTLFMKINIILFSGSENRERSGRNETTGSSLE